MFPVKKRQYLNKWRSWVLWQWNDRLVKMRYANGWNGWQQQAAGKAGRKVGRESEGTFSFSIQGKKMMLQSFSRVTTNLRRRTTRRWRGVQRWQNSSKCLDDFCSELFSVVLGQLENCNLTFNRHKIYLERKSYFESFSCQFIIFVSLH